MLLQKRELLAGADLSSLEIVASGSAPLAPWMVRAFQEEFGIVVVNIFGSNEGMALASSGTDVPDPEQRATLFPRFGVEGIAWANPLSERYRTRLVDIDTALEDLAKLDAIIDDLETLDRSLEDAKQELDTSVESASEDQLAATSTNMMLIVVVLVLVAVILLLVLKMRGTSRKADEFKPVTGDDAGK